MFPYIYIYIYDMDDEQSPILGPSHKCKYKRCVFWLIYGRWSTRICMDGTELNMPIYVIL